MRVRLPPRPPRSVLLGTAANCLDDEACDTVMRRYHFSSKREAVNFALRTVAAEAFDLDEARRLRGSGWDGDLEELRANHSG